MQLVDANVLLYAVNEASPRHRAARAWLDASLTGNETVAFAWVALLAFLRLATHEAVFPRPLSSNDAIDVLRSWLVRPTAVILEPTRRHLDVVAELLSGVGTAGNLVNDVHLAALALEHGCELVSFDSDFARFPGLHWQAPGD
ncbi:MAG: type II toxin-antitoxin system VapC family toxin [Actinobacteria bacterium]|nr:type II toxin-antitoxin system VapC family toxin [Actinomycetota bacterium]